jgi:hypothetical protein
MSSVKMRASYWPSDAEVHISAFHDMSQAQKNNKMAKYAHNDTFKYFSVTAAVIYGDIK